MGAVAGKVMMRPRGDYDPSAVYDILDLVKHNNKPWICKQNNVMDIEPSETNSEYWMLFIDISVADADTLDGFHASYFAPASMLKLGVYNVFPIGSDVTSTMAQIFDASNTGITFLPPNWTCASYSPTGENGAWQIIIFKNENGTAENGYKQYMSAIGFNKNGLMAIYNRDTDKWTKVCTTVDTSRVTEVTFEASGWSDTAPYAQTVAVAGITSGDTPLPLFVDNGTSETESKAKKKAYSMVTYFDSGTGTITATCKYKKPETTFTVGLKGV